MRAGWEGCGWMQPLEESQHDAHRRIFNHLPPIRHTRVEPRLVPGRLCPSLNIIRTHHEPDLWRIIAKTRTELSVLSGVDFSHPAHPDANRFRSHVQAVTPNNFLPRSVRLAGP
jgi:hypothetical protein